MRQLKLQRSHWPGCIENLFTSEIRREAFDEGAYAASDEPHQELLADGHFRKIKKVFQEPDSDEYFYVMAPDQEHKTRFADWIAVRAAHDASVLAPLRPLMERLSELVVTREGSTGTDV